MLVKNCISNLKIAHSPPTIWSWNRSLNIQVFVGIRWADNNGAVQAIEGFFPGLLVGLYLNVVDGFGISAEVAVLGSYYASLELTRKCLRPDKYRGAHQLAL